VLAYKQLGQWKEARVISDEMLAEARSRKKYVKECQGLITASAISVGTRQYERGEAELREAIRLAGGFVRLLAGTTESITRKHLSTRFRPQSRIFSQHCFRAGAEGF